MVEITTAPAPALVRFSPIADVPADTPVLSFDYFCASGMESLVPIINGDAIADPVKIDERRLRVPVAEGRLQVGRGASPLSSIAFRAKDVGR